jgi:uncharacterized protein (DUF1330 family)
MSVHVAILIHKMKDEAAFAEYRKSAASAIAKHGGSLVAPPSKPIKLDGTSETPAFITLLSFPSKDAAESWRNDPELIELHAQRHAGIEATIFAF